MGMTMTQKILAKHAGLESVTAGQLIEANVDLTLANDITGPVAIREMEKAGFDKVFDNTKIALVMDHFAPNKDNIVRFRICRRRSRSHFPRMRGQSSARTRKAFMGTDTGT